MKTSLVQFARERLLCWAARKPRTMITFIWFFSMALALSAFICACASASKSRGQSSSSQGTAFAAMWFSLVVGVLSIFGTYIMRKMSTPIMVGVLIGLLLTLEAQTLIVFSIVVSRSQRESNSSARSALSAFAVFSFFLFLVYGVLSALLFIFSADIIKIEGISVEDSVRDPTKASEEVPMHICAVEQSDSDAMI
jgi:hypothetical protein